ncbi:hypothetical protein DICPUDRAFT_27751 [Dictyostelium purpureum]|uniref:adenine phosphoribosyltransferase n=1 Tax=Dictyostelium purpureum TaxID=5786 RepID=F0ZAU0_DICPU|nr:uncharacterized protein DICPUDRAFT_27751 [Dictyostelium purpureum]EGC38947.1 hypothetical protein DICPUDRAFT_27751 [Dictyostelium purpureum]|eukprot:XP_003284512.1 hypothetical protein DICPUDRAFT_27751 [Dictyostelium purpureum]
MQESYQELQNQACDAVRKSMKFFPDWPNKGVGFQDISGLFLSHEKFNKVLDYYSYRFNDVDLIVCLEARGFVLGTAFAQSMKLPFILIRKKGKLPGPCYRESYKKEYGADEFEVQENILSGITPKPGKKFHVLIMDDILATGGTLCASIELVKKVLIGNGIKDFKISTSLISSVKVLNGKEKIYEKYNDVSIDIINEM